MRVKTFYANDTRMLDDNVNTFLENHNIYQISDICLKVRFTQDGKPKFTLFFTYDHEAKKRKAKADVEGVNYGK